MDPLTDEATKAPHLDPLPLDEPGTNSLQVFSEAEATAIEAAWFAAPTFWPQHSEEEAAERARDSLERHWHRDRKKAPLKTVLRHLRGDEAEAALWDGVVRGTPPPAGMEGLAARLFAPYDADVMHLLAARYPHRIVEAWEAWDRGGDPFAAYEVGLPGAVAKITNRLRSDTPARRDEAERWVRAHAAEAIGEVAHRHFGPRVRALVEADPALLPQVVRTLERLARPADLGRLVCWYGRDAVIAHAEEPERIESLLDPLHHQWVPQSQAHQPKTWPPSAPVHTRDGQPLDAEVVAHVVAQLRRGPGPRHPWCVALRERLDPTTAAAWADEAIDHFVTDKAKPQNRWVLVAAVGIGGEAAARRLIREGNSWPRSRNRNHRNHLGLLIRLLADLGTPTTLAILGIWSEDLGRSWMCDSARTHLTLLAERAGVPVDQLLDTELDLGFDADGSLVLDYGPRTFTVTVGDDGRALGVRDAKGKPRAKLPKPGKRDDPDLAAASLARFAELSTLVPQLLAAAAARLERAMVHRTAADAEHVAGFGPLRMPVARGVVWRTSAGLARPSAEGWRDVHDDPVSPEGEVFVVHPLHLSAEQRAAWTQALAAAGIRQPFDQLQRTTYAPSLPREGAGPFQVPGGRLFAMLSGGWRGEWDEHGHLRELRRDAGTSQLRLGFDPVDPKQVRGVVVAARLWAWPLDGTPDAVVLSEAVRDLS